jgi:hypothetical protein
VDGAPSGATTDEHGWYRFFDLEPGQRVTFVSLKVGSYVMTLDVDSPADLEVAVNPACIQRVHLQQRNDMWKGPKGR